MWRCVDLVWTNVSEERITSIFRVEKSASEEPAWAGGWRLNHQSKTRWFLACGFFYPEDGGDTFLRNVGSHNIYTLPHPSRRHSSESPPWKPQIVQRCNSSTFTSAPYLSRLRTDVSEVQPSISSEFPKRLADLHSPTASLWNWLYRLLTYFRIIKRIILISTISAEL
jgi:hypothetical protein